MKLISCNSNRPLADNIAAYLDIRLTNAEVKTFKDREVFVKVNENVRGQDVYVIQSTSAPANDHLMELLITIDALVRASARRITDAFRVSTDRSTPARLSARTAGSSRDHSSSSST